MKGYRPEEPHVLKDGPTFQLAERVANWIEDPSRLVPSSKSGWAAGVYGGRGTGKTSFLLTLLAILQSRAATRAAAPPPNYVPVCALPDVGDERALIAPAATRTDDDLLFLVLSHIEERYTLTNPLLGRDALAKARMAEVRRKDKQSFIEYSRDISPSNDALSQAHVDLHSRIATTTATLKEEFKKIIDAVAADRRLVLLVDDVDLRPERALEMLEIAHLFLNRPGVVVILTADRDLLLHSIQHALERRGVRHPGLAAALLAKYVPHAWALPIPNESERLDDLWPESPGPSFDPSLSFWWPPRAARILDDPPPPIRAKARQLFASLLPPTFRGLAAMHNRLLALQDDWRLQAGAEALVTALAGRFTMPLGLPPELVPPFVSMVVALDVRHPELGLLEILNQDPVVLATVFERVLVRIQNRRDPADADRSMRPLGGDGLGNVAAALERLAVATTEPMRRADDPDELWPALDRLRTPYLEGRHLGEAKRLVEHLAIRWAELRLFAGRVQSRQRFLAITVTPNTNALDASRVLWSTGFVESEARDWHLDLRAHIHGDKPQPTELGEARRAARAFLGDDKRVRDFSGQLVIFAFAPAPFLIWLGWMLDREQEIIVYNARTQLPYGPVERLLFTDRGAYETVDVSAPAEPKAGSSDEAIVLVDLTPDHKGTLESLDRFRRKGASIECRHHCLMTRRSSQPIEPEDLIPILRDILELIGQLRRDRGVRHLHLALAGPDVVAFFLGRQLKAQGMRISLYDLYGDHHEYVFDLEEEPSGDG